MYIGPTAIREEVAWILKGRNKLEEQTIRFSPALLQIYNEILVNAVDRQFDAKNPMSNINIEVDQNEGSISIENDGGSMPIERHSSGVYVPTLVFGEFMSGDNFDDGGVRFTGGRNGIGAKATNVFSKRFELEVTDPTSGMQFHQTWEDNMLVRHDPDISKLTGGEKAKHGVKVTFWPDLPRFGLNKIDNDHMRFFKTRTYDAAACTGQDVQISFNGKPVEVTDFASYARSAFGDKVEIAQITERGKVRAEIAVARSEGSFHSLGLVNGIRCNEGTHIKVVVDQLVASISKMASTKLKAKDEVRPYIVKKHLNVLVKAFVDRPDFDSQTKSRLTTTADSLGYKPTIPQGFAQRVADLGILDSALKEQRSLNIKELGRKTPGLKVSMAKLEDALLAGKRKEDCTLILTEGDSAKALAVAGLAKVGRRTHGIFPLRGKLLNVRSATHSKLAENEELKSLVQIIGLQFGMEYTSETTLQRLRYQRVMIFSDQDLDGHHIAGLVINFFHANWPSLLEFCPTFIQRFASPIVKVFQKSSKTSVGEFFTQADFDVWKAAQPAGWEKQKRVKYYKGLGTSTRAEAIQYFSDPDRHILQLEYDGEDDDEAIRRAFEPHRSDDRKVWINNADYSQELNYSESTASYVDFFNKQFVHFSNYDCWRSIPLLLDGLKPSQRKVLHIVRRFKSEKKVAQLTGLVSAETSYHHGESSLVSTIVGLAQNFVGTNNVNLLNPNGQFGTRLRGPSEHASERYIYTEASSFCSVIFRTDDDAVLRPQFDDGQEIEPKEMLPIVPVVLLNGCRGIGTGWATDGPSYNPLEVAEGLMQLIRGEEPADMLPWYAGFKGEVERNDDGKMYSLGRWSLFSSADGGPQDTLEITELPVEVWTDDFVERAERVSKQSDLDINVYKCADHDDQSVHLLIGFSPERLDKLRKKDESAHEAIGRLLNLRKRVKFNLWLFHAEEMDEQPALVQFTTPVEVLRAFYRLRLVHYVRRREQLLAKLRHHSAYLENRVRFVRAVGNQEIKLNPGQQVSEIEELLEGMDFQKLRKNPMDEDAKEEADFDYLLRMPFKSWTLEKAEELEQQRKKAEQEVARLESLTAEALWLEDLEEFREVYQAHMETLDTTLKEASMAERKEAIKVIHKGRKRVTLDASSPSPSPSRRSSSSPSPSPRRAPMGDELEALTNAKLKEMLKQHKLKVSGKKEDLVNRLLLATTRGYALKDWNKQSVASLRKHAVARGLQPKGKHNELVNRIIKSAVSVPLDCATVKDMREELGRRGIKTTGAPPEELRKRVEQSRLNVP